MPRVSADADTQVAPQVQALPARLVALQFCTQKTRPSREGCGDRGTHSSSSSLLQAGAEGRSWARGLRHLVLTPKLDGWVAGCPETGRWKEPGRAVQGPAGRDAAALCWAQGLTAAGNEYGS